MGQEVVEWLGEKRLSSYIPIFLHHGLDTLLDVSVLSREQVSQLAEEHNDHRDLCRVVHAAESCSEQDRWGEWELELWHAISSLDHDPRARTMTERLEWFEDSAAAWYCRGETATPNMLVCPLPWARLQKKVAFAHTTRTLTFVCA